MSIDTNSAADALLLETLLTPEGRADPYSRYERMREMGPRWRTGFGPIVVTSHADCMGVLRDPRLGRGAQRGGLFGDRGAELPPEMRDRRPDNMLLADPPDHTRLRQLVSRAFTPKRVDALVPAIVALVDGLLDEMAEAGEVDLISAFALPLPMAVIGELVGVPEADRSAFQPLVRSAAKAIEPILAADEIDEVMHAQEALGAYFADLVAARRARPADDLLSGLAQARDLDDRLTDEEVVSTAILLFAAGFETTTNLIGNGMLALLQHPNELARWRKDPGLDAAAVDELLRWDSPVQLNGRSALEAADLDGEELPEGQMVIVLQGAGNRDPARFAGAGQLDVGRSDNMPVSFGWGIHHCIGAALARSEGQIAFRRLLDRFSTIDLVDAEPDWRASFTLRGLNTLRLTVGA